MDLDAAPTLVGRDVRLRAVRPGDAAQRASLGRRREIVRGFGGDLERDEPMSEREAEAELHHRFGPGPHWAIADIDDLFVGVLRLAPVDVLNRSARFSIGIFDPGRLGQGLGSEATRLALGYGFESLGLHRVGLTVLADNTMAVAAYRKCGFVEEGRLRQSLWRDGVWHDDLSMSLLAPEWAAQQAR